MVEEAKKPMFNHVPAYSWVVLICSMICFMCFFVAYNGTAVFGPVIQEQMQIDAGALSWLNNFGMAGFTILPFLVAGLSIKTGIKKWVVICLSVNILSGLLILIPWFGTTYEGYAVSRFIQGCVGSMNGPIAAQLCLHFTKNMRGFATGIFMGFLGVGFSVTSFIAPRIYEAGFTWQESICIMTVAVSIIGIIVYLVGVRTFHDRYGEEYVSMDDLTPEPPETVRSHRFDDQPKPSTQMEILKIPRMWWQGLFGASTAVIIYGLSYSLPLFFTGDLGMDLVTASSVTAATFVWKIVASPIGGLMSDRLFKGERFQTNMIGTVGAGIMLIAMAFIAQAAPENIGLITVLTIIAFMFGSLYGGTYWVWNFEMSEPEIAPIAGGWFVLMGNMGSLVFVPILGAAIDATGSGLIAMFIIAGVALISAIPAYLAKL